MKGCLIFILSIAVLVLCGVVMYLVQQKPEAREQLVVVPARESENEEARAEPLPNDKEAVSLPNDRENGQLSLLVEKVGELLKKSDGADESGSLQPDAGSKNASSQYMDADKAFAVDELFAITSKKMIPRLAYTDIHYKGPFTKYHPEVHIVRAMGRETRKNYLFIVPREFYSKSEIFQKFTKAQMSNYEYFLSEKELEKEIFHRRFRHKMID